MSNPPPRNNNKNNNQGNPLYPLYYDDFPEQLIGPSPSRDRDNNDDASFISDITGDLIGHHHYSGMMNTPSPPRRQQQQQQTMKATSLLSGATQLYQSFLGASSSRSNNLSEDEDSPQHPQHPHQQQQQQHFPSHPSSPARSFVTSYDDLHMPAPPDNDDDDEHHPRGFFAGFDFLKDPREDMTYSRRLALQLLKHSWYYPKKTPSEETRRATTTTTAATMTRPSSSSPESSFSPPPPPASSSQRAITSINMEAYPFRVTQKEYPSLEKAWAYFEHVALPRYIVQPKLDLGIQKNLCTRMFRKLLLKGDKQLSRAEPGERNLPTKLYEPVFTPHKQMGDFGLGIGLYFSTLRALTILTLMAGLMNLPNIIYFRSPEYSDSQSTITEALLLGSSICTETAWVVCPSCHGSNSASDNATTTMLPADRLSTAVDDFGRIVPLALKNQCNATTLQQGYVNYATLLFVILGTFCLNRYLKHIEVVFDEDEQTAQDYSIVIRNPPHNAKEPTEWKDYFETVFDAQVTTCTVAVDNDLLVKTLVERREVLRQIEMKMQPGTVLDKLTLTALAAKEERERNFAKHLLAKLVPGIPELVARWVVLTAKIQGLAQQDYPVTNVFVTFETEADQRKVLTALSLGSLDVSRNNIHALPRKVYAFRGDLVLAVEEPDEPNTIRWQDLNETVQARLKQQCLTLVATIVAIIAIAFIIFLINRTESAAASAFAISISNSIFPMFAKVLNGMESHSSEGGKQRSLYCKIALFRWVNTAIVLTIITPFTSTISNHDGLINKVYALFFAEIITTNAIQLADPVGHFKRHYLAPRAQSQDAMNLNFSGTPMELAERYTNMTKILFLTFWYCAIYPAAFFMCSLTLFIAYYADKFSLTRIWKRQPHLGPKISEVSRVYFFPLSIAAMAIVSSYYWSAFPFDNICESDTTVDSAYWGTFVIGDEQGLSTTIAVTANDTSYQFCNQDLFRYETYAFPFIPIFQAPGAEWMTPEQEQLTTVYGWTAVGVVALVLLQLFLGFFGNLVSMFKSTYKPTGNDQGINFSNVPSISTFIPQIESTIYSYPLLACNVDNLDVDLLEWTDPDRPHVFYDLTKDAEVLIQGMDVSANMVFSRVAHFPPKKQ